MKPAEIVKEMLYPFSQMAILLAALFFWLIFSVVKISLAVVPIAGLIGAAIIATWALPAIFRYLLFVLEARANNNQVPALDAELFGLADKLWSLAPLILVAVLIWGGVTLSTYGAMPVAFYYAIVLFLLPASIAILAITQSPLESLNPRAIFRMVRVCGPAYMIIPIIFVAFSFGTQTLFRVGLPQLLLEWLVIYEVVLLFTFTGAVLHAKEVPSEVEIESPTEASADEIAGDLDAARAKVASHAYGFISRGNREGGFAHILDWIRQEPDASAASEWFFAAMMKWEAKEPALFFAQTYFSHLIHQDEDMRALKLISTCVHVDPTWRPKVEDRPHALELARKYQRDDLLPNLRN